MSPSQGILTRRSVLRGLAACTVAAQSALAEDPIGAIERKHGGRLGVFAWDTASGRTLAHRADERFLFCSACKVLIVAAVLAAVDAHRLHLDQRVPYNRHDLLAHAPVTAAHVAQGSLPLRELCAAAMEVSDNTAANLLFSVAGGPAGLTRFLRTHGDQVTRSDRTEIALNFRSGELDTTTPRAMAHTVLKLATGDVLSPASRAQLVAWMIANETGNARLRAGLPNSWRIGDRTGTSKMECNDVALAWPPGARAPLVIAAFYNAPAPGEDWRDAVLREVGSAVAAWAVH